MLAVLRRHNKKLSHTFFGSSRVCWVGAGGGVNMSITLTFSGGSVVAAANSLAIGGSETS